MTYSPEEAIELNLIQADAQSAVSALHASVGHAEAASILFASFPPAVFVAEETHNYFAQRNRATRFGKIDGQLFDDFGNAVKKVRARIKLLDDNDLGPANLITFMETVRKQSQILFAHPTSRSIQAISAPFRPDIGASFADQYLISTTHALLPTLGITQEVILSAGPGEFNKLTDFVRKFTKSLEAFFVQLKQVLALHTRDLNLQTIVSIPQSFTTTYNDFGFSGTCRTCL